MKKENKDRLLGIIEELQNGKSAEEFESEAKEIIKRQRLKY